MNTHDIPTRSSIHLWILSCTKTLSPSIWLLQNSSIPLRVRKLFNTPVPVGKNQEIPCATRGSRSFLAFSPCLLANGEFCPVLLLQTSVVGNVDFLGDMYSNVLVCFAYVLCVCVCCLKWFIVGVCKRVITCYIQIIIWLNIVAIYLQVQFQLYYQLIHDYLHS